MIPLAKTTGIWQPFWTSKTCNCKSLRKTKKHMDFACSSHIYHRPPHWEEKLCHLEGRLLASPLDSNFVSNWMFNVTCDCISPNEIETYCKFQSITLTHHDLFEDKTPENRTNFTASAISPVHVLVLPKGTHTHTSNIGLSPFRKLTNQLTESSDSTYQLVTNYHEPPRWILVNRSKRPPFFVADSSRSETDAVSETWASRERRIERKAKWWVFKKGYVTCLLVVCWAGSYRVELF